MNKNRNAWKDDKFEITWILVDFGLLKVIRVRFSVQATTIFSALNLLAFVSINFNKVKHLHKGILFVSLNIYYFIQQQ